MQSVFVEEGCTFFPPQDPRVNSLTTFSQFTAFNRCCILNQKVNVRPFEKSALTDEERERQQIALCYVMLCFVFKQEVFKMATGAINSRSLFVACSTPSERSQNSSQETQTSVSTLWKPQSQRAFGPKPEKALNWQKGYLQGPRFLFLLLQAMAPSCFSFTHFFLLPNKPSSLV